MTIEKELERYRWAFQDGHLPALIMAVETCHEAKIPLPDWCFDGVRAHYVATYYGKGPLARKQGHHHTRTFSYMNNVHLLRWEQVNHALSGNYAKVYGNPKTIDEACAAVALVKSQDPPRSKRPPHPPCKTAEKPSAETIKRSYRMVEKAKNAGKAARFFEAFRG